MSLLFFLRRETCFFGSLLALEDEKGKNIFIYSHLSDTKGGKVMKNRSLKILRNLWVLASVQDQN